MSKLSNDTVIDVKLVNGERIKIRKGNIVGYCHLKKHKGCLTLKLLKEHDCVAKKCSYLEIKEKAGFWENQAELAKEKQKRKSQKKLSNLVTKEQEKMLSKIQVQAQEIAKANGYDIVITSVADNGKNNYTIFYVSNNRENDYKQYEFLIYELLRVCGVHCQLAHIKDINGAYATIDNFNARNRKK